MRILYRVMILVFCFIAAFACYVFGIPAGGVIFLVLGFTFEVLFWKGLLGRKRVG